MFSFALLSTLALSALTLAAPLSQPAAGAHALSRRANSTTPFEFYDIPTATTDFVTDVTIGIDYLATATLTNDGDSISIPVTGNANINGTVLALESFSLTDPAIFLLDGEYYPAAARLTFTDGSVMSFLFILTPTEPDTPVINTMLTAVGDIPASGDSTTISALDFTTFIETYVEPDVFYTVTAAGTDYYVRQLPLSMELDKWRALKKVVTVSATSV